MTHHQWPMLEAFLPEGLMDLHKPLLPCSHLVTWLRKGEGHEGVVESIICIKVTKSITSHPLLYSIPQARQPGIPLDHGNILWIHICFRPSRKIKNHTHDSIVLLDTHKMA